MNDETKEILDRLYQKSIAVNAGDKGCYSPYVDEKEWSDDIDLALDYITNLQQKYEELQKEVRVNNDLIPYFKNKVKELKKEITNLQQENERLKDLIGEKNEIQNK